MIFVRLGARVEPVLVKPQRDFTRENHRWTSTGVGNVSGTLMTYLKGKAKNRGLVFEVTAEELWNLFLKQNSRCALSGVILVLETKINAQHNLDRTYHTASLDRIDNNKGYTIDNVQWVHKVLNHMRRQYSIEEYIAWCRLVTQHQDELQVKEEPAESSFCDNRRESHWGSDWVDDGV